MLLLNAPASALTETIRHIEKNQSDVIKILVAHRLSTVRHADRIHVFEKGKIVEEETHDELVHQSGLYAALWREQVSGSN